MKVAGGAGVRACVSFGCVWPCRRQTGSIIARINSRDKSFEVAIRVGRALSHKRCLRRTASKPGNNIGIGCGYIPMLPCPEMLCNYAAIVRKSRHVNAYVHMQHDRMYTTTDCVGTRSTGKAIFCCQDRTCEDACTQSIHIHIHAFPCMRMSERQQYDYDDQSVVIFGRRSNVMISKNHARSERSQLCDRHETRLHGRRP